MSTTSSSLTPRITTAFTFTGVETGVERGVDAGEHPVELVAAGEREEGLASQRVDRHVDPVQAGRRQVGGELGELHPVGGHGEVDPDRGEQLEEAGQVAAHRRLAAGDPDRLEPEALDADPGDPGLLLVGEEVATGRAR